MILPFEVLGKEEGPTIHFFHGFMGNHQDWIPVVGPLQDEFQIILWDLPGHGQSKLSKKQFCELYQNFTPPADYIMGYSMGGRLALMLTFQLNLKPKGMILESCHLGLQDGEEKEIRYQSDCHLLNKIETQLDLEEFFKRWYRTELWGHSEIQNKLIEKSGEKKIDELEGWKIAVKELSLGTQPNFSEQIHDCDFPILFITGELDLKYTDLGKSYHGSNIIHKVFQNAGHNTRVNQLANFQKELTQFITINA